MRKLSEEKNKHRYVYIGGDMVCSFPTNNRIYKYISNMGNKLSPYSIGTGEEKYYLLAPNFKFTKKTRLITILYWMVYMFQIQI